MRAPRLWNLIPPEIKGIKKLEQFKSAYANWRKTDEIALATQVKQSSCTTENNSKDNGDPDVLPCGPQMALKNLRASNKNADLFLIKGRKPS